jgi:hypothetical protein
MITVLSIFFCKKISGVELVNVVSGIVIIFIPGAILQLVAFEDVLTS